MKALDFACAQIFYSSLLIDMNFVLLFAKTGRRQETWKGKCQTSVKKAGSRAVPAAFQSTILERDVCLVRRDRTAQTTTAFEPKTRGHLKI